MGMRSHRGSVPRMTGDAEKRLEAALGYLKLGMFDEANSEIEQLPPEEKTSLGVLRLRAAIYSETKSWQLLQEVAGFLADSLPGDPQHWIWLAYAIRRTNNIPAAVTILLRALESHPTGGMIHFNLACYAAQTGKIEEAKERLREAIRLAPETRLLALDDPDLEPLW
jgi:Tfp pilus assembly protein PilF